MRVDQLQMESSSFIRNAQIIDKKIEWIGDVPKATVKMRVPLRGNYSIQSIVEPYVKNSNDKILQTSNIQNTTPYSGLLIDLRGVMHQPAMYVNLKTSSNNLNVNNNGLLKLKAAYYSQLEAIKQEQVNNNPYIIQASTMTSDGDIVLDTAHWNQAISVLARQKQQNQIGILF
ncbi:MAG: hypothetical protein R3240_09275, partial [Gammaproteobacteria bacterium]|nr:hypothetical protein [Gammaproteobacteria bacterium]